MDASGLPEIIHDSPPQSQISLIFSLLEQLTVVVHHDFFQKPSPNIIGKQGHVDSHRRKIKGDRLFLLHWIFFLCLHRNI